LTFVAALGCVASLTLPAVASGAHAVAGATYTGNSGKCATSIRQQCLFKFRVSSNGQTLRYVKKGTAISSWTCQGGGGEAVFGSGPNDTRIPAAHIRASGAFSGHRGTGTHLVRITGSFSKSGKRATLKFLLPNQHCHTSLLTLHKR